MKEAARKTIILKKLKLALEGIRTDASLRSDYSLIKQWALGTENE